MHPNTVPCTCCRPGTRAAILTRAFLAAPWLRSVHVVETLLHVTVQLRRPWWAYLAALVVPRYRRTRVLAAVGAALQPVQVAGIRYSVTTGTTRRWGWLP